ncbi:hypothetical protein BDR06DRAFT_977740, partial [Suillus hirtellus]
MLSSIGYVDSLSPPTDYMKEPVRLKRKALDDFIDSSQRPTRKRRASYLLQAPAASAMCDIFKLVKARKGTLSRSYAIADLNAVPLDAWASGCQSGTAVSQGHAAHPYQRAKAWSSKIGRESVEDNFKKMSKRKALEEVPSGSSPPKPKKHYLSRSPVIANLIVSTVRIVDSVVQSSYWPFPNELVLNILEILPAQDLRSIAQVSCLSRELAAPLYLRSVGLEFDDKSLFISTEACLTLLLYRRTTFFHTPKYLRCNLLDADDRHLKALQGFLESFEGTQVFFLSIVKDGEMLGDFAPLFQSIQDSSCRSLRFSDREASYHAYPPPILPNFIAVPTPPHRCTFQTFHANSPVFLSRSMVSLTLASLQNSSLTDLSLTHTSLTDDTPRIPLHSLRVLAGPLWYLVSLLHKVRAPQRIQTLELHLDEESLASAPNYLSAILDITQQFVAIDCLGLSFYHGSLSSEGFDIPSDKHGTIPVKKLTMYLPHWYKYSEHHPL